MIAWYRGSVVWTHLLVYRSLSCETKMKGRNTRKSPGESKWKITLRNNPRKHSYLHVTLTNRGMTRLSAAASRGMVLSNWKRESFFFPPISSPSISWPRPLFFLEECRRCFKSASIIVRHIKSTHGVCSEILTIGTTTTLLFFPPNRDGKREREGSEVGLLKTLF